MPPTFTVESSSLTNVKDKVVLITGGSSGIGLSTAELIFSLSTSNRVAILDRAPPPASLTSSQPADRLLFHQCDVASWPSQRAGFEAAVQKFGRVDVVFVNAGINEFGDQFFTDELDGDGKLKEPDRRVLDVDLTAAADTVKLAIHYLRRNTNRVGSIILTASFAGYISSAGAPLYSTSKHGLVGLMRALKPDTKKFNIAISVLAPAITVTPLLNYAENPQFISVDQEVARLKKGGIAINRPETVALAVGYIINGGMQSNGVGILVQADRMTDLELGYAKSRESVMGKEMLAFFRQGLKVETYRRVDKKAKI